MPQEKSCGAAKEKRSEQRQLIAGARPIYIVVDSLRNTVNVEET